LFLALLALPLHAAVIPLFNTGVDATGTPLPGGSADPHWTIISGPTVSSPTPGIVLMSPNGLYAEDPASRWIWVDTNGTGGVNSPYTFELQFTLTSAQVSTATISGSWGVDNFGNILLNGAAPTGSGALSLPGVVIGNFSSLHSFTITGGFVAGINKLDFVTTDAGNPGALNVTNLSGTVASVPEATNPAILCLGAVAMMAYLRRRSRHS
jgi:hypothetical protein